MYRDIAPRLKLEETISHPIRPEEVIGFTARNATLGREAIVMNDGALAEGFDGKDVAVPVEHAEALREDGAELVVLLDTKVQAMEGSDFATEALEVEYKGRGRTVTMEDVHLSSENFRSFSMGEVEVGN